jgi:hypothetical protein
MRAMMLVAMLSLMGGCSCSRQSDPEPAPAATTPEQPAAIESTSDPAPAPAETQAAEIQARAMLEAVSTLHAYLGVVAGKDWAKADTYWSGGKPPPREDDYAVRGIEDLRSLRINNEAPKPLDDESPSRFIEIPVSLRIRKDSGTYEINGWYRLQRKATDDGWEIASASLQPSMG